MFQLLKNKLKTVLRHDGQVEVVSKEDQRYHNEIAQRDGLDLENHNLGNLRFVADIEMETWTSIFKRNSNFQIKNTFRSDDNFDIRREMVTNEDGEASGNEKIIFIKKDSGNSGDFDRYYDMVNRSNVLSAEKKNNGMIIFKDKRKIENGRT